jgi:hypothetical protein
MKLSICWEEVWQTEGELLYADPHPVYGGGKIHLMKDGQWDREGRLRTQCGKTLENCPGRLVRETINNITCKVCRSSLETQVREAEVEKRWAVERAEAEAERTAQRIEWIQCYRQYLGSASWQEKRRKVLERCRWMCEGCGNRRAVEVHHKEYPEWPILPGSEEWKRLEKLYQLVGLCEVCHGEVHGKD